MEWAPLLRVLTSPRGARKRRAVPCVPAWGAARSGSGVSGTRREWHPPRLCFMGVVAVCAAQELWSWAAAERWIDSDLVGRQPCEIVLSLLCTVPLNQKVGVLAPSCPAAQCLDLDRKL